MGIVLSTIQGKPAHGRLRDIIDRLDPVAILGTDLLALLRWIAEYYISPLSEVMQTALPGALRIETEKVVEVIGDPSPSARISPNDLSLLKRLRSGPEVSLSVLEQERIPDLEASLKRLRRRSLIRVSEHFLKEVAPTRFETLYSALPLNDESAMNKRPALRALHEYIERHPNKRVLAAELRRSFPGATRKLRQLQDLRLIRRHDREVYRTIFHEPQPTDQPVKLNTDQQCAVDAISSNLEGFFPFLLLGVTGSGKTEVYLRIIGATLDKGKSALVLVPEISLTHQLVARVRARFGEAIAVLHSGLGSGERWDEWRRLARGEARIAIGARSAVFAPMPELGAIIVDEEHDGSYKQADGVRYNARDVAVMRAKIADCVLVLGSATASMESMRNASTDRYRQLTLPNRVAERAMPEIEILDLRGERLDSPLSPHLEAAIEANLIASGQTLLFLNRRGFANAMQCIACGEALHCPNCSIALTWHDRTSALRCHYCDYATRRPTRCAVCGQHALTIWGWGTERLEAHVRKRFPGARVARMDRDTTRRKGSMAALLSQWNSGKLDILIGTQMITKGHDVAGVTLVGVVMADLGLNLPDFRACEKTYQQLVQVAGRAGRGNRSGHVVIQTLLPDHYVMKAVVENRFTDFAEHETEQRREFGYPPFGRLALIRFECEDLETTKAAAAKCCEVLRSHREDGVAILGPAPAAIERIRGRYRWHVLLRGAGGKAVRDLAATALRVMRTDRRIRTTIDVDPQSLL